MSKCVVPGCAFSSLSSRSNSKLSLSLGSCKIRYQLHCRSQARTEITEKRVLSEEKGLRMLENTTVNGHSSLAHQSTSDQVPELVNGFKSVRVNSENASQIADFLEGKSLLVTGATGFLAKVLVEKILREQPKVGHIYLVIQPRTDSTAKQRLEDQVVRSQAFDLLRESHSDEYMEFMSRKLTAVAGNISRENLGMSPEMMAEIRGKVDVVINSAATTTFDERYDVAMSINTLGPKRIVEFAKSSKKVQLLLHVSTAFTNGTRVGPTPEKPFRMGDSITKDLTGSSWLPGVQVGEELSLIERTKREAEEEAQNLPAEKAEALLERKMVELGMRRAQHFGWQDTYVFTKAMGEMLVGELREELPVAIVRPSIVESSISEPLQGWMEGIRMADPILLAYGKGQMDGFIADPKACLDVVPVDFVINAMLAMLPKHFSQSELTVYHVATSVCNPLTNSEVSLAATEHFSKFPMMGKDKQPIRNPPMQVFPSTSLFQIHMFFKYQLPLQIEKLLSGFEKENRNSNMARRRNSLMLKTFEQLSYFAKLYRPYTFYKCRFDATNTVKLFNELSEEDKKRFNFDLTTINWREYFVQVHLPGLRKFVLKGRGSS